MLAEDLRACVGDLGSALFLGSAVGLSAVGFSSTHAAPEVMLGDRCTPSSDVYSLGILLIELTTLAPVVTRSSWRMPIAPQDCPQVRPCRHADRCKWQAGRCMPTQRLHINLPSVGRCGTPPSMVSSCAPACTGHCGSDSGMHRERPGAAP